MSHLQDIQPDAYDKLCQVGPDRWSRARCPLVHYNYLTSNSVESVNACIVVYKKLPVLKLVETYCAMVQDWYYKRRKLAENMTYEIIDWAANKVKKNMMKSAKWVVCGVSDHQYQVYNRRYNRQVDFQRCTCQCHKWRLSGLPCGHVIAVISNSENVRSNVLMKLQEALDEEAILEEQILTLVHRFADRFTDRRVKINNLMVLQDHPLIDNGKYALRCMIGVDMKKCEHLKSVRD
nr:transposase, MuDR, MULE transposase domain protein [Tanacetum cinerariifolium]